MQPVDFTHLMSKTKQIVVGSTIAQLALALLAGILFYFWGRDLLTPVEIIAAIATVLFLLSLAFLWYLYLRQPETREKYRLSAQIRQTRANLAAAQTRLGEILVKKEMTQRQLDDEEKTERERFQALAASLQEQVQQLSADQDLELRDELTNLQEAHLENGLRNIILDPAQVPGIGDYLAEKLSEHGIRTAYDVSQEKVDNIPGFGEAKTLSLLRWRESEEYKLKESQPATLPQEELAAIGQKYAQLIQEKQAELKSAQQAHDQTLQAIRLKHIADLTALNEDEASTRLRSTILTNQQQETQARFLEYRRITFLDMLATAVFTAPASGTKRIFHLVAPFGYLALGMLNVVILIAALVMG